MFSLLLDTFILYNLIYEILSKGEDYMVLNNATIIQGISLPKIFENKLFIAKTINLILHDRDIFLINTALKVVSEQLLAENCNKIISLNMIFTCDGSFLFSKDNDVLEFGAHCNLAIYRMDLIHEAYIRLNEQFVLFVFIEEMVHHYWRIEDEKEVKYKVLEIIRRYDKNITLETVKGWKLIGI